ncbi:MAG: IS66 family transposase [Bacteroides sp.]|nr:IS66 family transposase [Bacteroides sp.]
MITSVEDLDKMIAQMVVARQPEKLKKLGIGVEFIASLLRPAIEILRRDALVQIEKHQELLRLTEEKQQLIDKLKNEVFQKTIEIRKLQSRLDELCGAMSPKPAPAKPQATSENSSLPPSKDPIGFKRTQSLRQKSNRPNGGQPGHKGHTKEQTALPNTTIECTPSVCPECGRAIDVSELHVVERRQIWDLPLPIAPIVTEYIRMEGTCQCGHCCKGDFPQEATAPVSYGPNVHALVGYMSTLQSIPFKRMVDILNNVFGLQMSQGTVSNILQRMRKKAAEEMQIVREGIENSAVVGADETGIKINGEQHWVWTFQTDALTYMTVDKGRGKAVIDKHFPEGLPESILVTDPHSPYFNMNVADHQVCIAHLLRNLIYLSQIAPNCDWPIKMMELLREAIHVKHQSPQGIVDDKEIERIRASLDELMDNLPIVDDEAQQKTVKDFILHLSPKKEYLLTFLTHPAVPADNNASERSVRPVKTKMKVSGQFKSAEGANTYTNLHSIVQTARKQNRDPFIALSELARK